MRVIAGHHRRRTLIAPRGLDTRPTSDRLRETLFNILAPRLAGASFLDLYAGSGANGIEALSRGASRVVFVEQAAPALSAIRANLAALKIPPSDYSIEPQPVATWLRKSAAKPIPAFDILLLDPPYDAAEQYTATLTLLGAQAQTLRAPNAIVVAEHRRPRPTTETPAIQYGSLARTRVLEQGDAALSFYHAAAPELSDST
jgi:16S rRNA (guanine(966)-N(2))-methyltransferase RsmD